MVNFFLKFFYRINAEYFVWEESKTVLGEHIRKGKERVLKNIKEDTGLVLDVVCTGGAKGGTSTDGKQGRRFFSEELIPTLQRSTKEKYHNDLLQMHSLLSAILRVMSSQQPVNLPVYKENCKTLWVKINYTLHGVLHHSPELIALNGGYALGALSEEGLEASNKFIRRFLELLSRKTSPVDQMTDVISRLLERSHPSVTSNRCFIKKTKSKRKTICLHCDSGDHKTFQHDKKIQFGPKRHYDFLVDSLVLDS